jgi:hypothetical protein
MEMNGHLHAPGPLLPGKEPPIPIGYEAEWALEPVWTRWSREKFRDPAKDLKPDDPARSPAKAAPDW